MTPERELAERALSTAVGLRDLSNVLSPNPYASPGIVDGAHGECVNELDVVYGRYRAHKATRTPGFINSESRPEPATWYAKMETNDGDSSEVEAAIPSSRAAVTLAHALGRWREAASVSAVRSTAKRERDKLRAILREQADTCDAAVNAATAEIEDLMEALAESGSENSRLRWRWSARAGVLTERCDGYRREANRLRARAIGLETQLSGVEAHITNAATDFETLREKLNESRRETERARAGEDEARRQLVSAQAAAAEAIAAAARVASSPTAMNADVYKTATREAAKKELKEELRAEIEAELRAEFEVSHRGDTFVDVHARSGSVAKSVESVLHDGKSAQVRQLSAAKMEATARCSGNLAAMKAAGVETLKLDEDESHGGVESSELIALIAAHALQRCEAHPHGDGARAFYRAARRVELAAMACQPQYKKRGGRGS
jgi:regulator of replication initiation timing